MPRKAIQNIFSDRSSLVLRALLREPEKRWTVPDFAKEGVSFGLASEVLGKAESLGFVERAMKGRESFSRLLRKDELLKEWLRAYSFDKNYHTYYLSTNKNFLKYCRDYLEQKKIPYALTLYSASRLISPYVKDDREFIYVDVDRENLTAFLKEAQVQLNLYKLVHGGNVCFAVPFYRSSVFKEARRIRGYSAVSNLQLYLDLMTFPPVGQEEAEHFVNHLKKEGIPLA